MKPKKLFLSTSEVAEAAGVNRETLRFYEEKELVSPVSRTAAGYRQYTQGSVALIAFIKEAQAVGFNLKEIGELLELKKEARDSCDTITNTLRSKVDSIDGQIAALQHKRSVVQSLVNQCCASPSSTQSCGFVPQAH
jgi:DNA-binding transcriptional MerR regulator